MSTPESELSRLDDRVRKLQRRLGRSESEVEDARVAAVAAAVAVGLLVLLATTWLTPDVPNESEFASPRTGLGLLDGDMWSDDQTLARWVAVLGVLVYVVAAVVALVVTYGGRGPMIVSAVGLLATISVVIAKPEYDYPEAGWEYAWQAPPYVACVFWLVLIGLFSRRPPRPG